MKVTELSADSYNVELDAVETVFLKEMTAKFPELRPQALAFALSNRFFTTLKKFKGMLK